MIKLRVKIFCLLISFLLLSCNKFINHFTADTLANDFSTGVKGQVFISPVSSVSKDDTKNKVPFEAILNFVDSNKITIKKIQTDENGRFETALDTGKYTIIPEPIHKTGQYPIGKNKNVTIIPGKIIFVEIDFDSGIR
jgi:hypothetical protein